jgi:prepilin-type N-terminal cleavage/methylation domain-containing protein
MRRAAGFTLIEVLVALVVTVAAITLLSQGFTSGARVSTASQNATRAALLAQRVLADFESGELSVNQSQSLTFEDEEDFTAETVSESYTTGVTHLTIRIRWQERGEDRTYELVRLMREKKEATTP